MVSPDPLTLAWNSKHSGHVRAHLTGPLDTYQLKLVLAKLLDASVTSIERRGAEYLVSVAYTQADGEVETFVVDRLINCTGFEANLSMFGKACQPVCAIEGRFPAMTSTWESENIPGLFFVGAPAQTNDFQKASSPFIGGFRYNARTLFHLLEERYHAVPFPHQKPPSDTRELAEWLARRMTRSARTFFQFGVLVDVLVLEFGEIRYYCELPIDYAHERFGHCPLYVLIGFEWGAYDGDVFAIPRLPQSEDADRSAFIHPVLRAFGRGELVGVHHLLEDLFAVFTDTVYDRHFVASRAGLPVGAWHVRHHIDPLEQFLRDTVGQVQFARGCADAQLV